MDDHKTQYILRSLQKIINKRWEFYVVSRIIHRLNDLGIEFITQQLVRLEDNRYMLTDIYFPQFSLHLEVDEPHHLTQAEKDERRAQDIVFVTSHDIKRLEVTKCDGIIAAVNDKTDAFVDLIESLKQQQIAAGTFEPWDFENKYQPDRFIARGRFDIEDNVLLRKQVDAISCFGYERRACMRGVWKIPDGSGDWLWFPRLYRHNKWHNELCDEGRIIFERAGDDLGRASIQAQVADLQRHPDRRHITFAKFKDPLGANLLRYVGTFKANLGESTSDHIKFDRVRTSENLRRNERSGAY